MHGMDIESTHRTVKRPAARRAQVRRQRLVMLSLIFADALLALVVWGAAYVLHGFWGRGELTAVAVTGILPNIAVWIGLRALLGMYPGYGMDLVEELRRQSYALAASLAIIAMFAVAFKVGDLFSRLLLILSFIGLALLAPPARQLVKVGLKRLGIWGKPVVILRSGSTAEHVVRSLQREWGLGFVPLAFFDDRQNPRGGWPDDVPYGGTVETAGSFASEHGIDTAILTALREHDAQLADFVDRVGLSFRYVVVVPKLGGITNSALVARDLAGTFGVEIKQNLLHPWSRRTKRTLDLLGAGLGGLLISPLLLATVVLIRLDSPGPAIYGQQRLGTGGRHFRCLKFRTMRLDAERALDEYLQADPDLRAEWERDQKLRKDPRVTRAGRFLRGTSLDELPQLWNVLRGEMSLVGPRPIVDAEVDRYGGMYGLYCRVTPGISGLWQVGGRSDTSYEERVALDAYYVRNWSVWLDFVILARTIKSVLRRHGAR